MLEPRAFATVAWGDLECRHDGCKNPVVGLFHAPEGCICFPDPVQALCAQHACKGMQNNEMHTLILREGTSVPEGPAGDRGQVGWMGGEWDP